MAYQAKQNFVFLIKNTQKRLNLLLDRLDKEELGNSQPMGVSATLQPLQVETDIVDRHTVE